MTVTTAIPMPRVRNPQVSRLAFDALQDRVAVLERQIAELTAAPKRGRPAKELTNDSAE